MTAASPAAARAAAIFGSCDSDHFLNPLVRVFIEMPMTGVLFRNYECCIWGRFSNLTEQLCDRRKKTSLGQRNSRRKECVLIFRLISKSPWANDGILLRPAPGEPVAHNGTRFYRTGTDSSRQPGRRTDIHEDALPLGETGMAGPEVSIVRQHWLSRLPGFARCRLGLGPGAPLGPRPSQPSPLRLHGEPRSPRCDRA